LPTLPAWLAALLLLAVSPAVHAGSGVALQSPFDVDVWSTADGLPQSSVIAITQTRDGYLWLGTLNGLVRFDGNSFTRFNVNNTPGLPSDKIVFLFQDSETNLWVGTFDAGLCVIRDGLVTVPPAGAGLGKVKFAEEAPDGTVWFCTDQGRLFSAHHGIVDAAPASTPAELYYRIYHLIIPAGNGDTWRLRDGRVERWHGDTLRQDCGPAPWAKSPVYARLPSGSGGYLQVAFDQNVTAAVADSQGNLLVGTFGEGVFWFGLDGRSHHLDTGEGLSNNFILALCPDREGNTWVGTDTGGIDRLRRRIFDTPAALAGGAALSVSQDAQGGLWTTFNLRGLAYYFTNNVQFYGIGHNSHAWSVLVDSHRQIWAGTSGEGLFRFAADGFRNVPAAAPAGAQINALFESRDGRLWVGGQIGLGCFDGNVWNWFDSARGLPREPVRAIAEDATGGLWVASGNGRLFTGINGQFTPADAPVKDVTSLLAGQDGTLWAGTSGHGLAWRKDGRWHQCSSKNGLTADDVGYLLEDAATNLWLGTYEGLIRVDEASLYAAGSNGRRVTSRVFLTRECSAGAQPAALRGHDGRLWFPTVEGVASLDPAALVSNHVPPPVVIESIYVDDVPQNDSALSSVWPQTVTLSPQVEQLSIHFTRLDFSAPRNPPLAGRFRWRLVQGTEPGTWTEAAGAERVAHFNHLSPGTYRFEVTACNEDGFWNPAGAAVTIIVLPPFWQTRWFLALTTLGLLGLVAGTIYLVSTAKLKRQVRTLHQKEMIERERARIARDLHDQLGANLTQVTLLGEMAEADKDLPAEVEEHARQICATARDTTRSLDEIVWAVNPQNDTLEGLANYACKYAQDYFALAGVSYRAELPTQLPASPILPEVRHNVFLAFKEAVNNVVKHAHATEARVRLQLEPGRFILSVADNGRGLGDLTGKETRNGLRNMSRRLAEIQGEFAITPGSQGGTIVQLKVPLGKTA